MELKVYTVDAFTSSPFSGNPAAVIPLLQPLSDDILQKIAAEFNLSETVYISPLSPGSDQDVFVSVNKFSLRWFTPTKEIPLCGHATLASAYVLFNCLGNNSDQIEFESLGGPLIAKRKDDNIILDFPSNPPNPLNSDDMFKNLINYASKGLLVKEVQFSPTTGKLLIRLDDEYTRNDLESLVLNPSDLLQHHNGSLVRGVIVTLIGGRGNSSKTDSKDYHFISRYFAPWVGIPEDPVTGSAHTVLGPYWSKILKTSKLECRQCSPRGGDLSVTVREDGRTDLAGKGILVIEGKIRF